MGESLKTLFVCYVFVFAYGEDCLQNKDGFDKLLSNGFKNYVDENHNVLNVEYLITDWEFLSHKNRLRTDGTVVLTWKNPSLNFSRWNLCNTVLHLEYPLSEKFAFINPFGITHHLSTLVVDLEEKGNVSLMRRFEKFIPCETNSATFPFGNTTCTLQLNVSDFDNNKFDINWRENGVKITETSKTLLNSGSISLSNAKVVSSTTNKEFSLSLTFSQDAQEILISFFIPSLLFLFPPLMTLLLGPMAITRCCVLMTSLILLTIHFHTNAPESPHFTGVNALSIWKLFSYLFVIGIFMELVFVTLLASVGRSRSCCLSKRKSAKYEMEPLYEEMNDLRRRKTRKTRNCCRVSALFFDFASFVVFGVLLVVFCYGYYSKRNSLVKMINEFEIESLYIL